MDILSAKLNGVGSGGGTTTIYPSKYYNTDGTIPTKHIFAAEQLIVTILGSGASATVHTVATDHLTGSNVVTNSSGAIEELMDYYPYGGIRLDEKAGTFSEQRKFAGHELDVDTGLSYMNARYYDAGIGRFVSQDPQFISVTSDLTNPQDWNSYSYARNNPLINIDPDGKSAKTFLQGVGVGIAGAIVITAAIVSAPITIPAAVLTGAAVAGIGLVGYSTYENYQAYNNGNISKDEFDYNAGSLLGSLGLPAKLGKLGEIGNVTKSATIKTGPYSGLVDPPTVGPGKNFTAAQKTNIYKMNMERNGGILKSDFDGQPLIMPQKSMSGVTPPSNEAQIDHITPKNPASPTIFSGLNSYSNAQVLSRLQNLLKSNK